MIKNASAGRCVILNIENENDICNDIGGVPQKPQEYPKFLYVVDCMDKTVRIMAGFAAILTAFYVTAICISVTIIFIQYYIIPTINNPDYILPFRENQRCSIR
jgi:hypothetical protein